MSAREMGDGVGAPKGKRGCASARVPLPLFVMNGLHTKYYFRISVLTNINIWG